MAKGREKKLHLPIADDLFSTQAERDEAQREGLWKFASELAEKTEIPCIVRNLSDDEATIVMVTRIFRGKRYFRQRKPLYKG